MKLQHSWGLRARLCLYEASKEIDVIWCVCVCVTNSDFFHLCVQWSPPSIPYIFFASNFCADKRQQQQKSQKAHNFLRRSDSIISIAFDCWASRSVRVLLWQHDTTNAAVAAVAIADSMGTDSDQECKMLNEIKYLQLYVCPCPYVSLAAQLVVWIDRFRISYAMWVRGSLIHTLWMIIKHPEHAVAGRAPGRVSCGCVCVCESRRRNL